MSTVCWLGASVKQGIDVSRRTHHEHLSSKDWRALYDAGGGPAGVRDAYEEARLLAAEHANRGEQVRARLVNTHQANL